MSYRKKKQEKKKERDSLLLRLTFLGFDFFIATLRKLFCCWYLHFWPNLGRGGGLPSTKRNVALSSVLLGKESSRVKSKAESVGVLGEVDGYRVVVNRRVKFKRCEDGLGVDFGPGLSGTATGFLRFGVRSSDSGRWRERGMVGDKSGIMMTEMVAASKEVQATSATSSAVLATPMERRVHDWNFRDCVVGDLKTRQVNI